MHDPADLKQRIQVAGYLGGRRQFALQTVRVQVYHIPRIDDRSFNRSARLLEFHLTIGWYNIFFFEQEQKRRITGGDSASMLQPLLFDPGTVHQRSIAAVQIPYPESSILAGNQAMSSRNGRV